MVDTAFARNRTRHADVVVQHPAGPHVDVDEEVNLSGERGRRAARSATMWLAMRALLAPLCLDQGYVAG
jgi:hypothetical protein